MNIYDIAFCTVVGLAFAGGLWFCLLNAGILATLGLVMSCLYLGTVLERWLS